MKKRGIWLIVSVLLLVGLLISAFGCKAPAPAEKTLNIGVVAWFQHPFGIDMIHGVEVMVDMDNKAGGLNIGGHQYKVNLIIYDSMNDQAKEVAAVNRLIFEDKVKFILGGFGAAMPDDVIPTTEANKVILCSMANTPLIASPNNHYSFNVGLSEKHAITGWFAKNYPELIKNMATAARDDLTGHSRADYMLRELAVYGGKSEMIFYPPGATDLSAVGTKVKVLNPAVFQPMGGPVDNGLLMAAVRKAGYTGPFYFEGTTDIETLKGLAPTEMLEGLITGAWPVEFEPALTQVAKDFKAAWIAKYGKWQGPEIMGSANYCCLRAGLEQAGSLDTDKVAAVISNGLKFEGPVGIVQMASRPDQGNDRTIQGTCGYTIKRIEGGKPVVIATMSLDEALGYYHQVYPKK